MGSGDCDLGGAGVAKPGWPERPADSNDRLGVFRAGCAGAIWIALSDVVALVVAGHGNRMSRFFTDMFLLHTVADIRPVGRVTAKTIHP